MNETITSQNLTNYDSAWSVAEYTREEGLRSLEEALIEEFFPKPPASVLDLGCGAGRTTIGLRNKGYQPIAIDLSKTLLNQALRRYPELDFRLMDATKLELCNATLDAALFSYNGIDCIYPVESRVKCMAEVYRVLKPNGIFIMSSHNLIGAIFSGGYLYTRGYWNAARMLAKQWNNFLAPDWYIRYADGGGVQHLYSAPPGHSIRQLQEAGFRIVDVCGHNGERRPTVIRMRQQHVHFVARKPL